MGRAGKMSALGVIPARMASSRFPGKPLKLIHGRPMIWHVWQRSLLSNKLDDVVIATCDKEIQESAAKWGAHTMMTSDKHKRANDRVAEVAANLACDIVVNIQGDEPLVSPVLIDDVVTRLEENDEIQCINPISEMQTDAEIESATTVKVAIGLKGRAVFFSRWPIPWTKGKRRENPVYRQVPIIGFRRECCLRLARLEAGPLEVQESIDMLCAIEHDVAVHTMLTEHQTIGVDTPEDLDRVVMVMKNDIVYQQYKNK